MSFDPTLRKFVLIVHIIASVGWIGTVAAYLVLDLSTVLSDSPETVRSAYVSMDLVTTFAIVPLALAALVTGIVISLGTPWGLFRHWWVLLSLLLTLFATIVLLVETFTIRRLAESATSATISDSELRDLPSTLVHSIGGLVVLVLVTILNVYKPRGVTRYGWRKQREEARAREGNSAPEGP